MDRLPTCPWVTRATHLRNLEIQVDKQVPVAYGYCGLHDDCAFCAGTGYKPNILLQLGRESDTVPCPYCAPDAYRKAVERILRRQGRWVEKGEAPTGPVRASPPPRRRR